MPSLASARNHYRRQQRITGGAVNAVRRASSRGSTAVADAIRVYQAAAITNALEAAPEILAEQGIPTGTDGTVTPGSLITDRAALAAMASKTETPTALDRFTATMVADAGRTAMLVDTAARKSTTGYVRHLTPPSCSRCAILAGRVYRYSTGFLRHPNCDCTMTPTNQAVGSRLVTDPMAAFRNGDVTGLSAADTAAVNAGADLGRVVNIRRGPAGLTVGGSVMSRAGVPTPAACLRLAADHDSGVILLRRYGYIR
jgi:hypothetical protein